MRSRILCSLFLMVYSISIFGQNWKENPIQAEELGHVKWIRSYGDALKQAKEQDKPIFILFQEVPGCATCKNYGNDLLTHPHIVEAIETYFVPLAIHNNKKGEDAEILRKFSEPSWNNPVARIIDYNTEKDITKRLNGRYDMESLIATLSNGILASNNLIPEYLKLLHLEHSVTDLRETHLSMYCFWSGEKNLGKLEGVVATQAGFMNGAEVIKIQYDANAVNENELIKYASSKKCADAVFTNDQREILAAKNLKINTKAEGKFRPDNQPKYYTFNTDYKFLPMTNLQAVKVNSALSSGLSPNEYLSPRQLEVMNWIKKGKDKFQLAIDKDFTVMWNKIMRLS